MSTHKHIDKICIAAVIVSLLLTVLFMNGEALGIQAAARAMGYENRLFDTSQVHTIDIVMDDWDGFIETCEEETYTACAVIIDGEAYRNVGIRAKGNTSLSTVSAMNSKRYSFKVEFDHYDSTKSYYGLDKLCLNNLIQDTTCMKDYLTYRMMAEFGVDTPLCSYVYVTVNGEDWGLYLAVEGVEEAFLQRNYGSSYGELYKPDSTSMGGGPGNGQNFNMDDFLNLQGADQPETGDLERPENSDGFQGMTDWDNGEEPGETGGFKSRNDGSFDGGSGSMGSSDVKLQYIDDDPDSYSNIFDHAKTDIDDADKNRLIQSLKVLGSGEEVENAVDVEEVIRYFVVHNFVCNGDSYTGSIIHNYYLYEEEGRLSMIPWDYNLAFGTFQSSNAADMVNDPIDTPLSVMDSSDRPMWGWILQEDEYIQLYHQYFAEFLDTVDMGEIIEEAYALIASYVEKDPTAFYTYEEFETGVAVLRQFCKLRVQSVEGQLDGRIPSTREGQSENESARIDASHITLSDMGSMGTGDGGIQDDMGGKEPWGSMSGGQRDMDGGFEKDGDMPGFSEAGQPFENPDGGMAEEFDDQMSDGRNRDLAPAMGSVETTVSGDQTWILLLISAGVLAAGLVIAFRFKRS